MGGNNLLTEIFSATYWKKTYLNLTLSFQNFKQSNRICDTVLNTALGSSKCFIPSQINRRFDVVAIVSLKPYDQITTLF